MISRFILYFSFAFAVVFASQNVNPGSGFDSREVTTYINGEPVVLTPSAPLFPTEESAESDNSLFGSPCVLPLHSRRRYTRMRYVESAYQAYGQPTSFAIAYDSASDPEDDPSFPGSGAVFSAQYPSFLNFNALQSRPLTPTENIVRSGAVESVEVINAALEAIPSAIQLQLGIPDYETLQNYSQENEYTNILAYVSLVDVPVLPSPPTLPSSAVESKNDEDNLAALPNPPSKRQRSSL